MINGTLHSLIIKRSIVAA